MEFVFVRHGPPDFDQSRWLHQYDLKQLISEYDASGVISPAPADLLAKLKSFTEDQVVCSTLPRSIDSARKLGFQHAIQIPELNEAELPCPSWLRFPVSYRIAILLLRIVWFLGYGGGRESYRSTLTRATDATAKLTGFVNMQKSALVVGHGIMNRLVCRKLKEAGWSVQNSSQSGYWSTSRVTILAMSEK